MSGLDKDRKRNQTIAFRMTPEERQELEARIKVTGKPTLIWIFLNYFSLRNVFCLREYRKNY